ARRQIAARNALQSSQAVGQMLLAARNARRRVVNPPIVLPRIAGIRGLFWILLHPAPPVRIEEVTELFRGGRLRLLRVFCLRNRKERESKSSAGNRYREQHEHANHHGLLPAASITTTRIVTASSRQRVP